MRVLGLSIRRGVLVVVVSGVAMGVSELFTGVHTVFTGASILLPWQHRHSLTLSSNGRCVVAGACALKDTAPEIYYASE